MKNVLKNEFESIFKVYTAVRSHVRVCTKLLKKFLLSRRVDLSNSGFSGVESYKHCKTGLKRTLKKVCALEVINGIPDSCYLFTVMWVSRSHFLTAVGLIRKELLLSSLHMIRNSLQVGAFAYNFRKKAKIQFV